mmetsp:Transcript_2650/g.2993  ORF Transcript_2650/g.2993 Transcript_2650/m.2993 type:complete len:157 (-) Transcript_2650:287-757(-)|eukprot:CAMPEP_0197848734 /NCGR_PEP_ID=MMETSP1438-20131217/9836_1 /TAXON_ID=1461541 /ORGANISM="Pterosperma sp., Strain CCMP1384" /LENGTH=156 /DNA_ID=CAMNT_0043461121 /DNA_START=175 /DNA_END=645 /DNA_ORIENTATION=+
MASEGGQGTEITALSLEQLQQVKEQFEGEIERLSSNFHSLQGAANRFHASGLASENLGKQEADKSMLVPMTSSLYVAGKTGPTDKILVDIGTGYYVEKTPAEGAEFCKRKVRMLKESMDGLFGIIEKRKQDLHRVGQVMMMKMEQQQKEQGKQPAV